MPFCIRKAFIWSLSGKEKLQIYQIKPVWNTSKSCYIFDDLLWTLVIWVQKMLRIQILISIKFRSFDLKTSLQLNRIRKIFTKLCFYWLQFSKIKISCSVQFFVTYFFSSNNFFLLREYRSRNFLLWIPGNIYLKIMLFFNEYNVVIFLFIIFFKFAVQWNFKYALAAVLCILFHQIVTEIQIKYLHHKQFE